MVQRLSVAAATDNEEDFPDETFFEALMKCQGSRIEDQRSSLPLEGAAGADSDSAAGRSSLVAPVLLI